ncbi:MAG: VOC family protein [Proteobacteria bacterium]|nr:VOC family protein [Pseudomonadota bacterium]
MAKKKVKPIPPGYHSVTPYLVVDGAARAIAFYVQAFGATEVLRIPADDGRIGHAEIEIGSSHVMLSDEYPEMGARSPKSIGGSPVSLLLYVTDVDQTVAQAVAAGATVQRPVEDKFYGDRSGSLVDPFGHIWHVSTHTEDVAPDELKRRAEDYMAKMKQG